MIVLSSIIWSLHPDLSLQRGCAYILTIGIAGYIAVRFTPEQALLVLARSFAIGGVCSAAFILLFPEIGIMSDGELEGGWRGVYPHKNPFGFTMAIALFVQIQLNATVEFAALDQRCDDSPMFGSAVMAGEERIFSVQIQGPDRTLNRIGVHFDAPVACEQDETVPMVEGVADGLGHFGAAGDEGQALFEAGFELIEKRPALGLAGFAARCALCPRMLSSIL